MQNMQNVSMVHTNRPWVYKVCLKRPSLVDTSAGITTGQGLKNAKNTKYACYATCGTVSIIEYRAHRAPGLQSLPDIFLLPHDPSGKQIIPLSLSGYCTNRS